MKAKKILSFVLVFAVVLMLCACKTISDINENNAPADEKQLEKTELVVFAASSLTETLTKLKDMYISIHPDVDIVFNFDSSGTLKKQIQEGAVADVFISASQKPMNQLDISASADINTEGLDFVLSGSRFDILENKVCLATPYDNKADISSYDDMSNKLKDGSIMLAVGNSDVPVGQYTQKIFEYYNLDEDALAKNGNITYGSSVKEVTTQVSEGMVDCGIIYQTDAYSSNLNVVDTATEKMCGRVIYPCAVMKDSKNPATAKSFLDFLTTDTAKAVFEEVGFSPIS